MKVKGKHHMKVINDIADDAFKLIHTLQTHNMENDEFVKVRGDVVQNLANGYLYLCNMLMECNAMPTPKNQRRFPERYH